jgi:hypothetical protein
MASQQHSAYESARARNSSSSAFAFTDEPARETPPRPQHFIHSPARPSSLGHSVYTNTLTHDAELAAAQAVEDRHQQVNASGRNNMMRNLTSHAFDFIDTARAAAAPTYEAEMRGLGTPAPHSHVEPLSAEEASKYNRHTAALHARSHNLFERNRDRNISSTAMDFASVPAAAPQPQTARSAAPAGLSSAQQRRGHVPRHATTSATMPMRQGQGNAQCTINVASDVNGARNTQHSHQPLPQPQPLPQQPPAVDTTSAPGSRAPRDPNASPYGDFISYGLSVPPVSSYDAAYSSKSSGGPAQGRGHAHYARAYPADAERPPVNSNAALPVDPPRRALSALDHGIMEGFAAMPCSPPPAPTQARSQEPASVATGIPATPTRTRFPRPRSDITSPDACTRPFPLSYAPASLPHPQPSPAPPAHAGVGSSAAPFDMDPELDPFQEAESARSQRKELERLLYALPASAHRAAALFKPSDVDGNTGVSAEPSTHVPNATSDGPVVYDADTPHTRAQPHTLQEQAQLIANVVNSIASRRSSCSSGSNPHTHANTRHPCGATTTTAAPTTATSAPSQATEEVLRRRRLKQRLIADSQAGHVTDACTYSCSCSCTCAPSPCAFQQSVCRQEPR